MPCSISVLALREMTSLAWRSSLVGEDRRWQVTSMDRCAVCGWTNVDGWMWIDEYDCINANWRMRMDKCGWMNVNKLMWICGWRNGEGWMRMNEYGWMNADRCYYIQYKFQGNVVGRPQWNNNNINITKLLGNLSWTRSLPSSRKPVCQL